MVVAPSKFLLSTAQPRIPRDERRLERNARRMAANNGHVHRPTKNPRANVIGGCPRDIHRGVLPGTPFVGLKTAHVSRLLLTPVGDPPGTHVVSPPSTSRCSGMALHDRNMDSQRVGSILSMTTNFVLWAAFVCARWP